MTRTKVKLTWVENENSRTMSLKKRRLGLLKKARELTILCDVKACMIIFSPKEAEPMVWPSVEAARDLLDDFFALPEVEKKKKETSLEPYLKEKTKKVHEQLMKSRKKNMEYVVDQLMMGKLHRRQRIVDLNPSEIYELLCFSKDKIMLYTKKLNFMQHPPMHLFEAQSEEIKTTTNEIVTIGGGQGDERAMKVDEAAKRIIMIGTTRENQSRYLMDQWFFPSFEPPRSQIHQSIGMEMTSYDENPNPRNDLLNQVRYLPYQGSNSNGNPNLEMEPVGPPVMIFRGLAGSVSQPLHHHQDMDNNPIMDIDQPRQYSFDSMSREFGVKGEEINTENGNPQFRSRSIAMTTKDGLLQEPPLNAEEGNADATSFDINRVWPGINNRRF